MEAWLLQPSAKQVVTFLFRFVVGAGHATTEKQEQSQEVAEAAHEFFFVSYPFLGRFLGAARSRQSRRHGVSFVFWVYFGLLLVICESCRKLQVFFGISAPSSCEAGGSGVGFFFGCCSHGVSYRSARNQNYEVPTSAIFVGSVAAKARILQAAMRSRYRQRSCETRVSLVLLAAVVVSWVVVQVRQAGSRLGACCRFGVHCSAGKSCKHKCRIQKRIKEKEYTRKNRTTKHLS